MKKYLLLTLLALLNSFVAVAQEPYAVFNNGILTFYYDNDRAGKQGTVYELNSGDYMPDWTSDPDIAQSITKVVFDTSFANARPVSTTNWFGNGSTASLTTIEGIENLNTSCVTSMKGMFYGCTGLTKLDLSHFDTSNVTNMEGLFAGCSTLTKLDLSHFDTSNVTNMASMFALCSNLTKLDLSHFDTRKVTNMANMFLVCSQLTTVYCGDNWNTGKVEDSSNMFQYCLNLVGGKGTGFDSDYTDKTYARIDGGPNNPGYLTDFEAYAHFLNGTLTFYYDGQKNGRQGTVYGLNSGNDMPDWLGIAQSITKVVFDASFADAKPVSTFGWFGGTSSLTTIEGIENLNTSCVTSMMSMFYHCTKLTTLNLRHFDTSNVTNMGQMFDGCSGLTTLDLSHFDTSDVTMMNGMFHGCTQLTTLDLSHFDTSNVTNMYMMFADCSHLTTIYCGDKWNTGKVENSENMFLSCDNLEGGAGTYLNSDYMDKTYARVDEGESKPGYLTLMGDANGDNVIDKDDALQILQYVVNKTSTASNVDINGDGVVDAQDASLILQQVAKKAKL